MTTLLILIPWALTLASILTIMMLRKKSSDEDGEDFSMDEHGEIIRVSVQENKAYWVYDNVLYESEVTKEPDFETARPIDVMTLSSQEMNELFQILDDLEKSKEGE